MAAWFAVVCLCVREGKDSVIGIGSKEELVVRLGFEKEDE